MPTYSPDIYDVADLDGAMRIILTPEGGVPSEERWRTETPYLVDQIGRRLSPAEGSCILDYGCGIGRVAKGLIERYGCRVIGVDISESMRALANSYVASERFSACSPQEFDERVARGLRVHGAVCCWVLQHCLRPEDDLKRILSALAGGASLFVVNNLNRVVPTDAGWLDDRIDIRAMLSRHCDWLADFRFPDGVVPPPLCDKTFIGVLRARSREAAGGGLAAAPAPADNAAAEKRGHAAVDKILSIPDAVRLALEHYHAGRMGEVETLCLKILDADPDNADALHLSGVLAHLAGKQAFALAFLEKAVRRAPDQGQFHYNLGVVYGVLKRFEEALRHYRKAVRLDGENRAAFNNLGNAAMELGLFEEARRSYERLIEADAENTDVMVSLGVALSQLGDAKGAARWLEKALEAKPDFARAHWELAHVLLGQGDFGRGWKEYEWRFEGAREPGIYQYPFEFPRWKGEPLAGRSILVHGEQGLGDEIMYASILPEIIAEAGRCVIACQPHLAPLFAHSFPRAQVFAQLRYNDDQWTREPPPWLAQIGTIDFQVPSGSLGLHRRGEIASFPGHTGYLRTGEDKTSAWKGKFAGALAAGQLRVGLVWSSNPMPQYLYGAKRARSKSMRLADMAPLAGLRNVAFASLQTWDAAREAADPPPGLTLLDCSGELDDFSDTAAAIANLDLVISVDTSVAHLCGAMGKEVWIVLPHRADWRWGCGERSLWYPGARLFRQGEPGAWEALMGRVAAELKKRAGGAGRSEAKPGRRAGKRGSVRKPGNARSRRGRR